MTSQMKSVTFWMFWANYAFTSSIVGYYLGQPLWLWCIVQMFGALCALSYTLAANWFYKRIEVRIEHALLLRAARRHYV